MAGFKFEKGSELARAAGRKGGAACPNASRTFARDPESARRAALIGVRKRAAERRQRAAAGRTEPAPVPDA